MANDILGEIDALKAELDALRPLSQDAAGRLAQKLRIEWNYHSNAIEGNTLTLGETRALILHGLTARGKPMRDHLDIEGHDDAVKAIEAAVHEPDALNQTFIRNLHKVLLKETYEMPAETPDGHSMMRPIVLGQYKEVPNNVKLQSGETHYFAPPDQVQSMMTDLIDRYRAQEAEGAHPIVVAATFHYLFVQIHPFDDGNGRMARLLMNLILIRHGYPIAMVQRSGRDQYIAEIEQVQATGSLAGFIAYVAECCRYSLELHLRAARGESIEDPEDIDREIAVFKQSLVATSHEGEGTNVRMLVTDVASPLYDYFQDKTKSFVPYFSSSEVFGTLDVYQDDGKSQEVRLPYAGETDELPRNAVSVDVSVFAELEGFRARGGSLDLQVDRTTSGTWKFELKGYDLGADRRVAISHVGDDLDELKKCLNVLIRRLMDVLGQWNTRSKTTGGNPTTADRGSQ